MCCTYFSIKLLVYPTILQDIFQVLVGKGAATAIVRVRCLVENSFKTQHGVKVLISGNMVIPYKIPEQFFNIHFLNHMYTCINVVMMLLKVNILRHMKDNLNIMKTHSVQATMTTFTLSSSISTEM